MTPELNTAHWIPSYAFNTSITVLVTGFRSAHRATQTLAVLTLKASSILTAPPRGAFFLKPVHYIAALPSTLFAWALDTPGRIYILLNTGRITASPQMTQIFLRVVH